MKKMYNEYQNDIHTVFKQISDSKYKINWFSWSAPLRLGLEGIMNSAVRFVSILEECNRQRIELTLRILDEL